MLRFTCHFYALEVVDSVCCRIWTILCSSLYEFCYLSLCMDNWTGTSEKQAHRQQLPQWCGRDGKLLFVSKASYQIVWLFNNDKSFKTNKRTFAFKHVRGELFIAAKRSRAVYISWKNIMQFWGREQLD